MKRAKAKPKPKPLRAMKQAWDESPVDYFLRKAKVKNADRKKRVLEKAKKASRAFLAWNLPGSAKLGGSNRPARRAR